MSLLYALLFLIVVKNSLLLRFLVGALNYLNILTGRPLDDNGCFYYDDIVEIF